MSTVTWIKCKTDNCYLVSDGKDAFLVDTGSAVSYDKVLEECSKYNMKLIVLTHTHFDHAENAAKLSKHFGIPVACHEADVELFESFDKQPMESYGIVGKVVLGKQGVQVVDGHGDALHEVCLALVVAAVAVGTEHLQGAEEYEVLQALIESLFVERAVAACRVQVFGRQLLAHCRREAGACLP